MAAGLVMRQELLFNSFGWILSHSRFLQPLSSRLKGPVVSIIFLCPISLCLWCPQALSALKSNSFQNSFPISLYIVKVVKSIAEGVWNRDWTSQGLLNLSALPKGCPTDGKPWPPGWDEQIPPALRADSGMYLLLQTPGDAEGNCFR